MSQASPGVLRVCGLGTAPEETATIGALHALGRCDVILVDGGPAEVRLLKKYCPGVRSRIFLGNSLKRAVLPALKRGFSVGLASRGAPRCDLARLAARAGFPCETYDAPSAVDAALAVLGKTLGLDLHGLDVREAGALSGSSKVKLRHPLLLTFPEDAGPARCRRLGTLLARRYPSRLSCLLVGPAGADAVAEVTISALQTASRRIRAGSALFIPGLPR